MTEFGVKGIGGFIAATFAGLFVGTFGPGFLPDRHGRRAVFTFSLPWCCVGSAIMALQRSAEAIVLWRFITGIGMGLEIVTIDSCITEWVPQPMRGRAMAFNQAAMFAAARPSWVDRRQAPDCSCRSVAAPASAEWASWRWSCGRSAVGGRARFKWLSSARSC